MLSRPPVLQGVPTLELIVEPSSQQKDNRCDSCILANLEMGRNEKRKSSESELDGEDVDVVVVTPAAVFKPGFFVPCHPLLITGVVYNFQAFVTFL